MTHYLALCCDGQHWKNKYSTFILKYLDTPVSVITFNFEKLVSYFELDVAMLSNGSEVSLTSQLVMGNFSGGELLKISAR